MMNAQYEQDHELLELLKQQDPKAFDWFYKKHRKFLLMIANSILNDMEEARDVVQDFFADFWHQRLYNKIEPEGRSNGYIKGYINRIVYNLAIDRQRLLHSRQKRFKEIPPEEPERSPEEIRSELEWTEEAGKNLLSAIEMIPPLSARVFKLSYLAKKSRNEIAEQLGISPNTVKNHLARAIKILRGQLKNYK